MKKIKGKKGVELTLNTIIIAIIVVLVLVVVVAFFIGSFTNFAQTITSTLFGTTSGYSRTLAVSNCRNYCQQTNLLPEVAKKIGPYCGTVQNVDENNDGESEMFTNEEGKKELKKYYCFPFSETDAIESLKVDCIDDDTRTQVECDLPEGIVEEGTSRPKEIEREEEKPVESRSRRVT